MAVFLRQKLGGDCENINPNIIASKYAFEALYDSTQSAAQQISELNRFILKGQYKSSVSSEISLNAMNIPQGSVRVTSGGTQLEENIHYTVDYTMGSVKIIDQGILNSSQPIMISLKIILYSIFSQNALWGLIWIIDLIKILF